MPTFSRNLDYVKFKNYSNTKMHSIQNLSKERFGAFSISAAVRPPYNITRYCSDCKQEVIYGVN